MKHQLLLILSTVFIISSIKGQTPDLVWVRQFEPLETGFARSSGFSLCTDKDGNVYTAGIFQGTIDFDPGPDTFYLTSRGSNVYPLATDIFIHKLDSNGNFLWVKQIGINGNDGGGAYSPPAWQLFENGLRINCDQSGNVIVSGLVDNTYDIEGNYIVEEDGFFFITKLSPQGEVIWTREMSANIDCWSSAMDKDNNIYLTGNFWGTVDFDASEGFANHSSYGGFDIYILKLDSAGLFQWVRQIGGAGDDAANSIKVTGQGALYLAGTFEDTIDVDPGPEQHSLTALSTDHTTSFLLKLDVDGNYIWAFKTDYCMFNDIAIDGEENVYITGGYGGPVDFDPGPEIYNLPEEQGSYIEKIDSSGKFVWVIAEPQTDSWRTCMGSSKTIYTTSFFVFAQEVIIKRYSSYGTFIGIGIITGDFAVHGHNIYAKKSTLYITGDYSGTVDFDPGPDIAHLSAGINSNAFIVKLREDVVTGQAVYGDISTAVTLFPNPTTGEFRINFDKRCGNAEVYIYNIHGQLVLSQNIGQAETAKIKLDAKPGIYLVEIRTPNGFTTRKLLKY